MDTIPTSKFRLNVLQMNLKTRYFKSSLKAPKGIFGVPPSLGGICIHFMPSYGSDAQFFF